MLGTIVRPRRTRGLGVAVASVAALLAGAGIAAAQEPGTTGRHDGPLRRGEFTRELLLTGELRAVRSIPIRAPQTNIFQMRIQFMAEEGSFVEQGDPLLDFDSSSVVSQLRELEGQILDAETQIVTRENELASALKDLEIELAEKTYEHERAKLDAEIDPEVVSRKEFGERRLALTAAERELAETRERIRLTQERGAADLDVLKINRDKLSQDLRLARQGTDRLSISAPADGLVVYEQRPGTTLRFQEGDSCWPGQDVMRLPDLSEMQVVFNVNEVDAPQLRSGMPLRISLDAFPGREIDGRIEQIPSMAVKRSEDSKIAVFRVVASLETTWVGEMKPGMSALGRVVVERRQDVPLVERAAVRVDGSGYRLGGRSFEPLARNEIFYVLSEDDYARLSEAPDRAAGRRAAEGGAT